MTENEKLVKVLTVQTSVYTALCCLKDILEEQGIKTDGSNQTKKPPLIYQNLLSAYSKIDDVYKKMNPELNFDQMDFMNQISYRMEDLVKSATLKNS